MKTKLDFQNYRDFLGKMDNDLQNIRDFFIDNKKNKKIQDLQIRFELLLKNHPGNKQQFSSLLKSTNLIIKKFKDEQLSVLDEKQSNKTNSKIVFLKRNNMHDDLQKRKQKYKENLQKIKMMKKEMEDKNFQNEKNYLRASLAFFKSAACKFCLFKKNELSDHFSKAWDTLNIKNDRCF